MSPKSLSELIELAKSIRMTDAERNVQRNSFVYGNTKIENQDVTWELVEMISKQVPLPLPDPK
jgi:hypothetical protein